MEHNYPRYLQSTPLRRYNQRPPQVQSVRRAATTSPSAGTISAPCWLPVTTKARRGQLSDECDRLADSLSPHMGEGAVETSQQKRPARSGLIPLSHQYSLSVTFSCLPQVHSRQQQGYPRLSQGLAYRKTIPASSKFIPTYSSASSIAASFLYVSSFLFASFSVISNSFSEMDGNSFASELYLI